MVFRPYLRRFRLTFSTLLLAVLVSVAVLSPLLHHDIVCHIQSPTHCTTCLVGSSAESPSEVGSLSGSPLVAIGPVLAPFDLALETRLPRELSGRSPPAQG